MAPVSAFLVLFLQVLSTSPLSLDPPAPNLLLVPQNSRNFAQFSPLTTTSPNNDHINCVRVDSGIALDPTYCLPAISTICRELIEQGFSGLVRDEWIWVEMPGCALGYFIPEGMLEIMMRKSNQNSLPSDHFGESICSYFEHFHVKNM